MERSWPSSARAMQLKTAPTPACARRPGDQLRWHRLGSRVQPTVLGGNTWYHLAGVYDAAARTLSVYARRARQRELSGTVPASQFNAPFAREHRAADGRAGHFNFIGRRRGPPCTGGAAHAPGRSQVDMTTRDRTRLSGLPAIGGKLPLVICALRGRTHATLLLALLALSTPPLPSPSDEILARTSPPGAEPRTVAKLQTLRLTGRAVFSGSAGGARHRDGLGPGAEAAGELPLRSNPARASRGAGLEREGGLEAVALRGRREPEPRLAGRRARSRGRTRHRRAPGSWREKGSQVEYLGVEDVDGHARPTSCAPR